MTTKTDAVREIARDFYRVLTELDAGTLGVLAGDEPLRVDDPVFGRWEGDSFAERFEVCRRWLVERSASFAEDALTVSDGRAVQEFTLFLAERGRDIELPVAVVAEDSAGLVSARVYHSTWPLTGRHEVRPPLLPCDVESAVPDVVGEYQRALASGDLDAILGTFGKDAYAREPAGGEWVYRGPERLRQFYDALFSAGGGIHLRHCTVTDDGTRCAIEYVADRWGEPMPPQAGVAVYERDGRGKLAAARIYDDVQPPRSADLSA